MFAEHIVYPLSPLCSPTINLERSDGKISLAHTMASLLSKVISARISVFTLAEPGHAEGPAKSLTVDM